MTDFNRFLDDFYKRHPNWKGFAAKPKELPSMSAELQKHRTDFQMLAANDDDRAPWPDEE